MQSSPGDELVAAVQRLVTTRLAKDPELRAVVVALAKVVLEACGEDKIGAASDAGGGANRTGAGSGESGAQVGGQSAVVIARPGEIAPAKSPIGSPRLSSEGIVPLKIGGAQMHVRVEGSSSDIARARMSAVEEAESKANETRHNTASPADDAELLDLIVKRTALKMQACDVAKQRRMAERSGEGKEHARQQTQTLIAEAKALPNCFLWMFMPGHEIPEDSVMDMMRDCYEALHLSAKAAGMLLGQGSAASAALMTAGMKMMAEAQSGLRLILKKSWMERDDVDQYDAFMWLRRTAEVQHIFVDRHMRLDDPADPARAGELREEIRALLLEAEKSSAEGKAIKKALNKIKYHAQRIADEGDRSEESEWRSLQQAAAALPALDGRAREQYEEMMAPVAELVMGDGVAYQLDVAFLEAMDALYQKQRRRAEKRAEREEASAPRYSAEVLAVRERLASKRLVLIGGTRFPQQEQRLRDAFALGDFDWVSLREHASSAPMEPVIAKPDTALVVAITRLAGHHHIDDARDFARKHEKLFVQLPAGHSPEQVARAVVEQVGERLVAGK